jgi:hypothetical protein
MSTRSAKSKARLEFDTFESGYHTANATLLDEMGNTFRIEVKGMDAEYVEKRMKYLVRKTNTGKGITSEFRPLTFEEKNQMQKKTKGFNDNVKKASRRRQESSPGELITVIEPVHLNRQNDEPHRLSITIDPPLTAAHNTEWYEMRLRGTDSMDVICELTDGVEVKAELFGTVSALRPAASRRPLKEGAARPARPAELTGVFPTIESAIVWWHIRVFLPDGCPPCFFVLSLDFVVL